MICCPSLLKDWGVQVEARPFVKLLVSLRVELCGGIRNARIF